MINVTVKTLDSQNHQFSVEDNITVEQFKRQIEDLVNVPADRQRIIYCGRVLQNSSKLKDYDVDGKVVHLVQSAPPTSAGRNVRSVTPPPDFNRARGGFRGFDRVGNTVYMGMSPVPFPQGFMDPQQMIPPRATHTLSASRLNVARRMLRHAEAAIRLLENPTANSDQPPSEEQPEEEMTPVIEARVIVPSNGDQPIDENTIVNAVENTIFSSGVGNLDQAATSSPSTSTQNNGVHNGQNSSSSTPETSTPRSSSTENINGENHESARPNSQSSRRTRGPEMAELLRTLNQLQTRFAPFLARYEAFMQEDPQVTPETLEQTRQMINRVSQILHFLGHAYHSLSDIMINVDQPPPRLLFCRPILIQHSAVVQAGIPIQVEAQINLSADRPGSVSTSTSTSTTATSTTTATSSASGNTTTSNSNSSSNEPTAPSITLQPGFVGLPFMPTGSMRVITTPIEFRTLHPRSGTINNNETPSSTQPSAPPRNEQARPSAPTAPSGESGQPRTGPPPQPGNPFGPNNGNLEFFMEVTPEGITIDSLEALAGSNQAANEFLRSGNLIQSLMQLVGSHLGGGLGQPQQQSQSQATTTTGEASQPNQTNGTQNNSQSQARGNTQTNPTTATHTRSTPRPHVHMTQQAVQGGFDPFLPCYSHHVTHSRGQRIIPMNQSNRSEPAASRDASSAQTSSTSTQTNQQSQRTNNAPPNFAGLAAQFENVIRTFPVQFPHLLEENQQAVHMLAESLTGMFNPHTAPGQQPPPQRGAPDGQGPPGQNLQNSTAFINSLLSQNFPNLHRNGPTLDQYIQTLYPNTYIQGENVVIDLIMLMLGNLRLSDLSMLTNGNMSPLHRQTDSIQRFFLNEIFQNDTSDVGIQRATDRVINDCRPIITALESVPPREGIDMGRTIDDFFEHKLSIIIQLAAHSGPEREGQRTINGAAVLSALWTAAKELLALVIHCSVNGVQSVEAACEEFMQTHVPPGGALDIIASHTRRLVLRTLINNLDIRPTDIQHFVIRQTPESSSRNQAVEPTATENNEVEAMEVDYGSSPTNQEQMVETSIKVEETEPLPNVIWGSESWHRQTPEEWVPIITRDIQKQRRQNSQPPFSDAYLSGMPSKRRKLVNKSKPQGSLPHVISESVREAVTSTGLSSVAPLDAVAEAAGQSIEIQTAYRTLLRQTVQANLRDNEDFTPEKFPNISNYFNGPPPE